MTKLQERLYQYIAEDRFLALKSDEEYIMAQRARNAAEKKLSAQLTEEQRRLFSRYMDEENHLASLQLRHVFQEALALLPAILDLP